MSTIDITLNKLMEMVNKLNEAKKEKEMAASIKTKQYKVIKEEDYNYKKILKASDVHTRDLESEIEVDRTPDTFPVKEEVVPLDDLGKIKMGIKEVIKELEKGYPDPDQPLLGIHIPTLNEINALAMLKKLVA